MLPKPTGRAHYERPAYHSRSFGIVSTKPPWFSIRASDKTRRPIEEWGNPRNVPRVPEQGPPFVYDREDKRLMRPHVIFSGGVSKEASPRSRNYVGVDPRDGLDHGMKEKIEAGKEAYRLSTLQRQQNVKDTWTSDVKETIFGRAGCMAKPTLYPQRVDHRIALQLDKKVGPKPWFYERRQSGDRPPDKPWDQTMQMPFSRTRRDFPHLRHIEQPIQEP